MASPTHPKSGLLKRRYAKPTPQPESVERAEETESSEDKNTSVEEFKTTSIQENERVMEANTPLSSDYVIAQKPFLLRMPKPLKDDLIYVLDSMPGRLSMQKFILKLVQDEVERLLKELGRK